ncbi:MAG: DsbA family protein [Pseudomonadota bacterium]
MFLAGALALAFAVGPAVAETAAAPVAVPDMAMGPADAKVTVVEYASYTCPHCAHFDADVMPKLKADYIDTGKIRFVYREVYFDKYGLWAAMVARCGGEMRYFPIQDMLYKTQAEWLKSGNDAGIADALRKIGLKAGIDKDALAACMNDGKMAEAMVATYQANATKDGIDSTPSFVINGEKYSNMSYEDFAKILDAKLAE